MIQFIIDHKEIILGILFGISELLSFVPSIKANGVFQFIFDLLNKAIKKP